MSECEQLMIIILALQETSGQQEPGRARMEGSVLLPAWRGPATATSQSLDPALGH